MVIRKIWFSLSLLLLAVVAVSLYLLQTQSRKAPLKRDKRVESLPKSAGEPLPKSAVKAPVTEFEGCGIIHIGADIALCLLFTVDVEGDNAISPDSDGVMPALLNNLGFSIVNVMPAAFKDKKTGVSINTSAHCPEAGPTVPFDAVFPLSSSNNQTPSKSSK